ncbi:MAG: excinuclease ABC subunit UvrC [Anaerolineales bacterium]|nr:excinuclease ABC subunit UvrC [Anaerolineales bacterium]
MTVSDHLRAKLDTLPTKPGCYLYHDASGRIIYVGKAINLRNRVRSYFHESVDSAKTRELVRHIADLEYIVVGSELEALILEMNLIKKHRPKYNIRLKDDKRYPYIKIHAADPFPKVTVTRRMDDDGGRYFGPYTSAWAVYQTLDVVRRIFPYLTCDRVITGNDPRACLFYDIKLCQGPCVGAVDQAQYRAMIDDLGRFLRGHTEPVVARLRSEMVRASEELAFERAAQLRDQLLAIERVVEKQKVVTTEQMDSDVIAFARDERTACVQVFFVRAGKLIGREYFVLEGTEEAADVDVMTQFVEQFYSEAAYVPAEVVLPEDMPEAEIVTQWLRGRRGEKVLLTVPRRGVKADLIKMAAENAADTLTTLKAEWDADTLRQEQSLGELQAALGLPKPPNRIECFDISNTQGIATVAAMVVFEQGVPRKQHYRSFNIQTVDGPNDFASMREALTRRFQRYLDADRPESEVPTLPTRPGKKADESFARLPDLLIIDGGKGQLGVAVEVLQTLGLFEAVPVCSLAKQQEEIFQPGRPASVLLPRRSPALYLVQRVRDEAHRFGLGAHRTRRNKIGLASQLDSIPGIGPTRRRALLRRFGSLEGIRAASLEDLLTVPGMTQKAASSIKDHL